MGSDRVYYLESPARWSVPSGRWRLLIPLMFGMKTSASQEKRGILVVVHLKHHLGSVNLKRSVEQTVSVPNSAFPTCGQHTKASLHGQYLLPVCLVHHSFVRRRGVQRTEHLHAFDSRSIYMRQWDHVGTNQPRKSMLASGSMFYRQASWPGRLPHAGLCL